MSDAEKMISPEDGRSPESRANYWLSGAGLRPTRQRIALAELLVGDGHDRHVTAESLFDAVQATSTSVSLATVYNTLRCFTEAGLVNEITVDGTRSYFDTNISDHAHFHFDDGLVMDATDGPVGMNSLPEVPDGYEIAKIDVVIRLRKKT